MTLLLSKQKKYFVRQLILPYKTLFYLMLIISFKFISVFIDKWCFRNFQYSF